MVPIDYVITIIRLEILCFSDSPHLAESETPATGDIFFSWTLRKNYISSTVEQIGKIALLSTNLFHLLIVSIIEQLFINN